jgi:hypothetical protein
VEGINITDSAQASSGVYFTAFSFEEVQIKTSGNDAEVSTPGISMVAVLKSGGNQFHGTYSGSIQRPEFESNNLSPELQAQGLSQTQPLKYYYDVAADLGGRIVRDKLWFYGAWNRQERVAGVLGFAASPGADGRYLTADDVPATFHNSLTVSTMKVSSQLTNGSRLIGVWQPSLKLQPQNGADRFRPLESTRDYRNPTSIYKGEIQSTTSKKSLLNVVAGYGGYIADYSADRGPYEVPGKPSALDRETGLHTGGHESSNQQPRDRWQVDGGFSIFPDKFLGGRHEMKVGDSALLGARCAWKTEPRAWQLPVVLRSRQWCVRPARRNRYLQLSVHGRQPGDKLCGVSERYVADWQSPDGEPGRAMGAAAFVFCLNSRTQAARSFQQYFRQVIFPALDVLTWTRTVPRAGLAWDLNGKTVLKTTFGIYNHMIGDEFATAYNKNAQGTAKFRWRDTDGNGNYTPGEVDLNLNGPDFLSITGAANKPDESRLEAADRD